MRRDNGPISVFAFVLLGANIRRPRAETEGLHGAATRQAMIDRHTQGYAAILERLSEDDWSRQGTHSESGAYSVMDWLALYAAHDHDHADQIRRGARHHFARPA